MFFVCLVHMITGFSAVVAQSQWRGPNRDGYYHETHLLKEWPAEGPKMLWAFENLGTGQGSVVVANDKVFVTGIPDTLNAEGFIFAFDMDLSRFRKSGGKLLMTYGWADQILQPMMVVNYYEAVVAQSGRSTTDFARLFMMPGVAHCGGGIGPDRVDAVTAVIDWVEKNKAPDSLLASKVTNGTVTRTRPLCPYPQVARYEGRGSIDEAANFRCVAPR
jgi:hypothetical protein